MLEGCRVFSVAGVLLWLAVVVGCGPPSEREQPSTIRGSQAFINGADDRQEYFELALESDRAALEQFAVALVPRETAELLEQDAASQVVTWGQSNELCAGEPFVDQPAAAFCSGVLVDWDLVLTSGHCVSPFALSDYRIVFGYYYLAPGELIVAAEDVYTPAEVLASRRDPSGQAERLDFAWIRLTERVRSPRRPAPVYTRAPEVSLGQPVISIGAGGGVPIKFDAGGQVRDLRAETGDYFVADTDTSAGSSGGGIFSSELGLLGTLARGAPDLVSTNDGCWINGRGSAPEQAVEQFTYAHRAVEALCDKGVASVLCDASCEQPCNPSPRPGAEEAASDGCALSHSARGSASSAAGLWGLLAVLFARKRSWLCRSRAVSGSGSGTPRAARARSYRT
jgi:trypsin-like peptidase